MPGDETPRFNWGGFKAAMDAEKAARRAVIAVAAGLHGLGQRMGLPARHWSNGLDPMFRKPATAPRKIRTGANARPEDIAKEAAMLAATNRMLSELLAPPYYMTQANIADALGVGLGTVARLKANLRAYSLGQRQAAAALFTRLVAFYEKQTGRKLVT